MHGPPVEGGPAPGTRWECRAGASTADQRLAAAQAARRGLLAALRRRPAAACGLRAAPRRRPPPRPARCTAAAARPARRGLGLGASWPLGLLVEASCALCGAPRARRSPALPRAATTRDAVRLASPDPPPSGQSEAEGLERRCGLQGAALPGSTRQAGRRAARQLSAPPRTLGAPVQASPPGQCQRRSEREGRGSRNGVRAARRRTPWLTAAGAARRAARRPIARAGGRPGARAACRGAGSRRGASDA